MIFEESFDHFIPGMFQRFIHRKDTTRYTRSTGELLVLVDQI